MSVPKDRRRAWKVGDWKADGPHPTSKQRTVLAAELKVDVSQRLMLEGLGWETVSLNDMLITDYECFDLVARLAKRIKEVAEAYRPDAMRAVDV